MVPSWRFLLLLLCALCSAPAALVDFLRKIIPTPGVAMTAKKRARNDDTDGDRTDSGGGGGGGGSDDSAPSPLRPAVGADVVFAKKILHRAAHG